MDKHIKESTLLLLIMVSAMKRLLIVPLALMLVGYATSSCTSSPSNGNEQNDSIAAAEREAARLDSIRQDSIARRNFTSPDLAFHDLHGDVKKCVYDDYATYTFDENGKWTNEPQWDESDKQFCPDRTKHPRVIRNKDGYITRIYWECDADYEYEDISWKDGRVHTRFLSTYTYNNDGLPIARDDEEEYDTQVSATYCNYEVDEMGNWVKRDVISKITVLYQNTVKYELNTETRTITYYKSDSGKKTTIQNNSRQNQALEAYNKYTKHKDENSEKGPEWIYGTWECKGTMDYGPYLGGIKRFTAKVIISENNIRVYYDGELAYNGNYDIEDGTIKFNRKSGYSDVIPIDIDNKRLEFGNGMYYNKVSTNNSNSQPSYGHNTQPTSFRTQGEVISYTSNHSFYNGGDRLRIDFDAIYLNGTALTGAPRVTNINGTTATVVANSPYSGGGALHFYVNASVGTITQNGDVFRIR